MAIFKNKANLIKNFNLLIKILIKIKMNLLKFIYFLQFFTIYKKKILFV